MEANVYNQCERERRLHQVVVTCLEAIETGEALSSGHLVLRYPEFAQELAEFFSGREQVERLATPLRQVVRPTPASDGRSVRLGEYRIVREVGRGGMGVVYEAVQESLGRHVALKVLPSHALPAAEYLERFRREARAAALLHHSNIVPVFGVGQDQGVHFYAMQFIHGQSLDRVLQELRRRPDRLIAAADRAETPVPAGVEPEADLAASLAEGLRTGRPVGRGATGPCTPFPEKGPPTATVPGDGAHESEVLTTGNEGPLAGPLGVCGQRSGLTGSVVSGAGGEYYRGVARIGAEVAEALAYAHRQGILHRDIKPANLLLDAQGTVWVTDFGLAKAQGSRDLTQAGAVVGTLRYLAPERFDGQSDPRGDIYSLGATLYELLTLRPAFDDAERACLIEQVTRGGPRPPRQIDGRIPRDLETIVLKAMARDPADRYQTAESLAEDLRSYLLDRPIHARRASLAERTWRWCRRNPLIAGLLAAAVVLAIGMAVLALLLWDKQQQTEAALRQADEQRQEAERRRLTAESNFERARVLLHNAPLKHQMEWLEKVGPKQSQQATMKKALALFQGLLAEPGLDPGNRLMTAQVHIELGNIYLVLEQHAESAQEYRRAIALLRPLAAEFPRDAGFRDSLAYCFRHLAWQVGRMAPDPAHLEEGEEAFGQAISLYEGLREEFRDVPWCRWQLADCWNELGVLRRRYGRFEHAETPLRRALALVRQLCDEFPEGQVQKGFLAKCHADLAWNLATRPDWRPHHAAEALDHAHQAVNLEPSHHDWWHTLGVAHCRAGHWREALEAIEKSRQLEKHSGPIDSFDRFFEAMAYAGLGDRGTARCCYDEAVQWMETHLPDHPDLRRFRAEAAQMLGITDKE
jgi:serine/threonine protein kinase